MSETVSVLSNTLCVTCVSRAPFKDLGVNFSIYTICPIGSFISESILILFSNCSCSQEQFFKQDTQT